MTQVDWSVLADLVSDIEARISEIDEIASKINDAWEALQEIDMEMEISTNLEPISQSLHEVFAEVNNEMVALQEHLNDLETISNLYN
jgi:predicted  nucleic acid-binding Zn-ribbon protein